MIKVVKGRKPAILVKKEKVRSGALKVAASPKSKQNAEGKYRHLQIKEALTRAFQGKCAFCESKISHVSYGHIEHYKPKSKYKAHVFDWDNLLLACEVCNGPEYKGTKFPNKPQGGPFVNPTTDLPTTHFRFEFDATARLANVVPKTRRGKTTATLIGLNRPELRAYRSVQVERLFALSKRAKKDLLAKRLLLEAKRANAEFSAFARAL